MGATTASPRRTQDKLNKKTLFAVVLLFIFYFFVAFVSFSRLPEPEDEVKRKLVFPRDIERLKLLRDGLDFYVDMHFNDIFMLYCSLFLLLQSFSLPGSSMLVILGGAVLGFLKGFILSLVLSTVGASGCYLMSSVVGKQVIIRCCPVRLAAFTKEVEKNKRHLLSFMLFLRLTPVLPNWLINLASPIVNVDFKSFVIGTFFGLTGMCYTLTQAGCILHEIESMDDALSSKTMLTLASFGVVSLLPYLYSRLRERKEDKEE
uniref:VTT domain-containing protein n=1 Tax=Palpitomonas bilix TaxID=652834 RepID=A0A7S3D9L0_9EUKA|mmetsp:Transcript_28089/g.71606  ORF Transcript_28089/g.71606 Transcript_28089/m.71606 type:complete len:261 (+) Transcript_28089:198-980(+)